MNEPRFLRLGDGTLIDVVDGSASVSTEINQRFADAPYDPLMSHKAKGKARSSFVGGVRRYIDDLPAGPSQSRAVAVVAAYSIFGLSNTDMSIVLGVDEHTVTEIKDSEAYYLFMDAMLQQLREHDTDKIRKRINKAAENAAENIEGLMDSRDEKIKLAASKDILDRHEKGYGTQGQDTASKGGLTIRIIDDRDNPLDKLKVDIG